jgi:hypothetical protein
MHIKAVRGESLFAIRSAISELQVPWQTAAGRQHRLGGQHQMTALSYAMVECRAEKKETSKFGYARKGCEIILGTTMSVFAIQTLCHSFKM